MMLAGPHGEFELVYSAAPSDAAAIAAELEGAGLAPVRLGTAVPREAITLVLPDGRRADIDMAPIRNLLETSAGDSRRYLDRFRELGRSWDLE